MNKEDAQVEKLASPEKGTKHKPVYDCERLYVNCRFCRVMRLLSMIVKQASLQSELVKAGGGQTGFVSLCREILTRFIADRFPTVVEGIVSDDVIY